ncbi:MAG TPA: hypothetical protein VGK02_01580 [Candidatus Aquicultor sp.]|jgi:SOS-response transcriptional repressor LexA
MVEVIVDFSSIEGTDGDLELVTKKLALEDIDYMFTVSKDDPLTGAVIADRYYGQAWTEIADGSKLFFKRGIKPEVDDIILAEVTDNVRVDGLQGAVVIRHFEPHSGCYILRSADGNIEDITILPECDFKVIAVCIAAQYRPGGSIDARELIRREAIDTLRVI